MVYIRGMPIVNIRSLPPKDLNIVPAMMAEIRDEGAKALGCETSNVWVTFESLAAYLPENSHPPIVTIKAQAGRTMEQRTKFVSAVANGVAHGLSIPAKNVWIHYEEMSPEDIWFNKSWGRT